MKILQGSGETPLPAPPAHAAAAPAHASAAPDLGRLDALEKIAKSILQRIQALEERLESLEEEPKQALPEPSAPASSAPAGVVQPVSIATPSSPPPALDAEAVKRGLLTKMWKYLNDERSSKAA